MRQVPMETLLTGLLERLDDEDLAEVCDTLSWKFQDNGTEMLDTVRSWLEGDDIRRIEAALTINNGVLFRTREEIEAAFTRLVVRQPRFRTRTEAILQEWDARCRPKAVRDVVEGTWPIGTAARIYGVSEDRLRRWIEEAPE
ncbi:hypothetical protein [Actinoallomurus iriomotensis]|uniref:Uncharacterized protein n=1 Tax=Actinoallomurus iriomotensis TaxID=478107 RepID=A0A9W6S270_9ACTN|nr:hypothetical protein [Actinoallomurus iriomotensis]GLY84272.1 hypothetical protein Airi02_022010 [Actinoallomurus iriomotensis]